MAGYDINVGRDLLPGLLSGPDGLAKLMEMVVQGVSPRKVSYLPRNSECLLYHVLSNIGLIEFAIEHAKNDACWN